MKAARVLLLALACLGSAAGAEARDTEAAVVGAGTYRPLFPASPSQKEIAVAAFSMDRTPVTNGQFLAFVKAHAEWRRDRVAGALAETNYLAQWGAADALGGADPDQPVVNVSWFAARAYCGARGMRLPTEAEWEHAADASATSPDASADPAWRAHVFALTMRPTPATLPRVGLGAPNFWGVRDLHGLVWEWVEDFSASAAAISSASGQLRFCGAGAAGASDSKDFPAFERVAFRSSLRANYTVRNLGFRCVGGA